MKKSAIHPLLLGSLALAVATVLPSCVDPYAHGPGPQHSVTTYHAGYEVRVLPSGYRTEYIDGSNYYVHNGTYYRSRSGRYVVVDAPRRHSNYRSGYDRRDDRREYRRDGNRDVVITQLPRGYRTIERRGVRYYQANNTYYQQRGSGYVVVTLEN